MGSKILLDANILLDLCLQREKYNAAKSIFELIAEGRLQAFVTPSIIHITAHWLTKQYGADTAKQIILALLEDVSIIDCTHTTTITALNSSIKDIEDALQYYTALHHKMDIFISSDKGLKKSATPSLPVLFPEELLDLFI